MNPMILLTQMFSNGNNPVGLLFSMMKNKAPNNEMIDNAENMYNSGDMSALEQLGQNFCKSQGLNPEEVLRETKRKFGVK